VNVALYLPLGMASHFVFRKFGLPLFEIFGPVALGFLLSCSVELSQIFEPLRQSSAVDVLSNTAGAALGVIVAVFLTAWPSRSAGRITDPSAALLAGGWFIYLFFPFVPAFNRVHALYRFTDHIAAFRHSSFFSFEPAISAAACWYVAGLLLNAAGARAARLWMVLALLAAPAQLFIVDRQPLRSELFGSVAGMVAFLLRPRRAIPGAREAWGFIIVIALRNLWPFDRVPAASAFSWIPFSHEFSIDAQIGLFMVLGQFVFYGSAIWLLRLSGLNPLKAIVAVTVVAAGLEVAKTHMAAAHPGITAPLLSVIAGYVLVSLSANWLAETPQTGIPRPVP
jgi:hypothetical protein